MPRGKVVNVERTKVSLACLRRLPLYLDVCRHAESEGESLISGTRIAEELGLEAIQVRKDLSFTGILGRPRIGYVLKELIQKIETFLQWDRSHPAILIGVGRLGQALLGYQQLRRYNLNVLHAFDIDAEKIGKTIEGVSIYHPAMMKDLLAQQPVEIAIIATPDHAAQDAATLAYNAGVRKFWNFTTKRFRLQGKVVIYNESLISGYSVLSVRSPT